MSEERKALAQRVEQGVASAQERARFDALLESEEFEFARRCVQSLPEDTPSMEWRSQLNESLRQLTPSKRRAWLLRPAMGFVVVGALALTVFWPRMAPEVSPTTPVASSLEASLVSTHREYVYSADLSGAGLTALDFGAGHKAQPGASPYDWVEGDLAL